MGIIRYGRTAQIGVYPGNQSGRYISYRSGGVSFPLDPDTQVAWQFFKDKSLTDLVAGLTLDFARASTGTYYDSAGVLQTAAINEPRFNHHPDTLESRGLLVEVERTNLFLNSLAPVTQSIAVANGTEYTVSMRGTGSVTLADAGAGTVTQGNPVTFTAGSINLDCTVAGGADWVQVEAGPFATSVIVTGGTSATRAVDDCSTSDMSWYNDAGPGTLYCHADGFVPNGAANQHLYDFHLLTNAQRVTQFFGPLDGNVQCLMRAPNTTYQPGSVTNVGSVAPFKIACAYDLGDLVQSGNGALSTAAAPAQLPDGPNFFTVGQNYANGFNYTGHIRELGYANVRKDDAFLQTLTTL